jgi:hypothetical protein
MDCASLLGFGQFLANLVGGKCELYVIASIDEHVCGECDQLWSQSQRTLGLADQDGFAIANTRLRNNTNG